MAVVAAGDAMLTTLSGDIQFRPANTAGNVVRLEPTPIPAGVNPQALFFQLALFFFSDRRLGFLSDQPSRAGQ